MLKTIYRIACLIPLLVYAVGVPLMLMLHGNIYLIADKWLPYEIAGLLLCAVILVLEPWNIKKEKHQIP